MHSAGIDRHERSDYLCAVLVSEIPIGQSFLFSEGTSDAVRSALR